MNIKSTLEAMLAAAGFCDPTTLRLVWVNPPLARLLYEHGLDQNISVRTLCPDLPTQFGPEHEPHLREEASLPAHGDQDAMSAKCQLGPFIEMGSDKLLMFHLVERGSADSSRTTLNIFSRHMNAREASWEQEREALLAQIKELMGD